MSKNDGHAASVARRLSRGAALLAVVLAAITPLAGCDLGNFGEELGEAIGDGLEDTFNAVHADVSVNASATETRVGACVGSWLPFPQPCLSGQDAFYFMYEGEWWDVPTGVAPMAAGTELTVYWRSPDGRSTFTVAVPPEPAINAPQAGAVYRLADTVTLQFADPGTDEVTIETEGLCDGDHPSRWRRVIPHDDATPGQVAVRADEIALPHPGFGRCDVTLRVTRARAGTVQVAANKQSGTITARTSAEVALQVVP